jgi:ribulose-phosphate 3-epimerase
MATIIPAILTGDKKTFVDLLNTAKDFADVVQIDFMDGDFVSSKSVLPREIFYEDFGDMTYEAHLMVSEKNLSSFINGLKNHKPCQKIYIHFEISNKEDVLRTFLNQILDTGKEVGLVINPDTPLSKLVTGLIHKVDTVMFMGVKPGFYGSEFHKDRLAEVKEFIAKNQDYEGVWAWDGGVSLENVKDIIDAGIDSICVGSGIFGSNDPKDAFQSFKEI